MPYYDYHCQACGHTFEVLQTYQEHERGEEHEHAAKLHCPQCGSDHVETTLAPVFVITSRKS